MSASGSRRPSLAKGSNDASTIACCRWIGSGIAAEALKQLGFGALLGSGLLILLSAIFPNFVFDKLATAHFGFIGAAVGAGLQLFCESTFLGRQAIVVINLIGFAFCCLVYRILMDRDTFIKIKDRGRRAILSRSGDPSLTSKDFEDLLTLLIEEYDSHTKQMIILRSEVEALKSQLRDVQITRSPSLERGVLDQSDYQDSP